MKILSKQISNNAKVFYNLFKTYAQISIINVINLMRQYGFYIFVFIVSLYFAELTDAELLILWKCIIFIVLSILTTQIIINRQYKIKEISDGFDIYIFPSVCLLIGILVFVFY